MRPLGVASLTQTATIELFWRHPPSHGGLSGDAAASAHE